jgi:hypothetical protein
MAQETGSGRRWVWVSAWAGGGCEVFGGSVAALWEVLDTPQGPRLELRFENREALLGAPVSALLHGDGTLPDLVIDGEAWLRSQSGGYVLESLSVPMLDCGC